MIISMQANSKGSQTAAPKIIGKTALLTNKNPLP
jgi:hypothetical protein